MADRPFKYPSASDLDPNVIDLLFRALQPKLEDLIDQRQQRRQSWGPTFKQEGIRIIPIGDADYEFTSTDYGKRTLIITGTLTAMRRLQLPILSGAWWIIRNDTAQDLKMVAGVGGTAGPIIPAGETAACYTDGVSVWTFPTFITGTTGGAMRLDEILNPSADTNLGIGNFQVTYTFTGAETENCYIIQTASNAPGGGAILYVRSQGTTSSKIPLRVDANAVQPAFIVDSDGTVGINVLIPQTNLHVAGGIRFDLGSDAPGDMLFRSSPDGLLERIPFGTVNQVLSIVETAPSSGIFKPAWVTGATGSGGAPDGTGFELQARNSPTTFKKVTDSIANGADVTLAGNLKVTIPGTNAASAAITITSTTTDPRMVFDKYVTSVDPINLVFNRAFAGGSPGTPADITGVLADGAFLGRLLFRGRFGGVFRDVGWLHAKNEATSGSVLELAVGDLLTGTPAGVRITNTGSIGSVTIVGGPGPGPNFFQVQTFGFMFSHGTVGSIYYRDSGGYFVSLDIDSTLPGTDEGKVLTVTDVGGGVLQPRWQAPTGGSGGFPPQGADGTLQYRSTASLFGAVTNSIVSGADITMGGKLLLRQATSFNQTVEVSATSTHPTITLTKYVTGTSLTTLFFQRARGSAGTAGAVIAPDHIGRIEFQGHNGSGFTSRGYVDSSLHASDGSVLEVGVGSASLSRVRISDTGGGSGAVTIFSGSIYFQIQTAGFQFSTGGTGCLYFRDASGYFVPTATPPAFVTAQAQDRIAFWDASAGVVKWLTMGANLTIDGATDTLSAAAGGGGGPTLNGTDQQILYRQNSTTMNSVSGFTVSGTGPDLIMGGNLTFNSTAGTTVTVTRDPGVALTNGQLVVDMQFAGRYSGGISTGNFGFLRAYWNSSFGRVLELGKSASTRIHLDTSPSNSDSITLDVAGGRFFQIQQSGGFRISIGAVGAIYYQADVAGTTFFTALEASTGLDGDVLTLDSTSGTKLPIWKTPAAGTGGIANTGGVTNSIQYKLTGTTMGGIATSTAGGILMVTGAANSVAAFSTTFNTGVRYSFAPDNTRAGLNVGQNLSLAAGSNPSTATVGDIYYNKFAEKFRFYQGTAWVELGGGGGGGTPVGTDGNLQYKSGTSFAGLANSNVTATGRLILNSSSTVGLSPTLTIDSFLTGSGALDDAYGQLIHFRHQHTGTMTGGRNGMTIWWDQSVAGGVATKGNVILQLYASNASGLSINSDLVGLLIDCGVGQASNWAAFYGIRMKSVTTNLVRYSIYTENGAGSAVFNAGTDLALSDTTGFLYIPTIAGTTTPTGNPFGIAGTAPICIQWQTNKLWFYNGAAWKSVTLT